MSFALTLLVAALQTTSTPSASTLPTAINGVWGDSSWVARYGEVPTSADSPDERVRVHLEETLARLVDAPTTGLDPATADRRTLALTALGHYIEGGRFPQNIDSPESRPEFIDHTGRLCAVGAMIAATEGHAAAEALDAAYNRDTVWAMNSPELATWAERHGFSTAELAIIQPSYSPEWSQPRTHRNNVVGVRGGMAVWGESSYKSPREGLSHTDETGLDAGAWWLWQPGSHWAIGGALNVRAKLYDYYEGSRAAVSLLVKGEYAHALAERGLFDVAVTAEAGPMLVPGSPGDFAGIELGGGLAFLSTLDLWQMLSFRLDLRVQHHILWGTASQTIEGTQVLLTLGAEWRFSL